MLYPILVMALEGFDADLSTLFSGKGVEVIVGVPFGTGGFHPKLANLFIALSLGAFPRLMYNTTIIDVESVGMALVAGIPAAYFLARSRLRGRSAIGFVILSLRTISPFALVIPMYLLFVNPPSITVLGSTIRLPELWDTYFGLALAYLAIDIPVVVLMLRSFFIDIPKETYEAAEVSGASESQIFWRIALPTIAFGIAATAIFAFVLLWNEFLLADILTGAGAKTVAVGVWTGAGEAVGGFRNLDVDLTSMFGFLAFIPVYIIILAIRKYLARGFSLATAR
jgi:multiple sugar transport system permease protein